MTGHLVIHVGSFKTGSTAIQDTLHAGLVDCPSRRILYPGNNRAHIWLAQSMRKRPNAPDTQARFAALADQIRASDADVAILSAEHFQMTGPKRLARWVETWLPDHVETLQVISYVRPHAEYLLSVYAEQTKLGVTALPFDAYLAQRLRKSVGFHRRQRHWARTFGERFTLRPAIRSRLDGGDAVRDFLGLALGGAPFELGARITSNRSLGVEDLAFLRRAQRVLAGIGGLSDGERRMTGNRLQQALEKIPARRSTPLRLQAGQLEAIRAHFAEDADRLDRRFFDGRPMRDALAASDRLLGPSPDTVRTRVSARQIQALWQVASGISGTGRMALVARILRGRS